jgi:hypothetical protein
MVFIVGGRSGLSAFLLAYSITVREIRKHTPGAKALFRLVPERPKAKALGYLEAKAPVCTAAVDEIYYAPSLA